MKVHRNAPARFADVGPLPLRVRTRSGEVVGRGVTGTPIDVPDGEYQVTVLLPDGREIGLEEDAAGVDSAPAGALMSDDPAPLDDAERVIALPPAPAELLELPASLWTGDWLQCWSKGVPHLSGQQPLSFGKPVFLSHLPGRDQLVVLRLADRLRCTVVPCDECSSCGSDGAGPGIMASLKQWPDGPGVVFRSRASEEANTLLSFVELGVLTNMAEVTEDEVRRGEQALQGTRSSALRAITGAYVLLRSNTLEGLDGWLKQLEPLAPRLPDLLPLRAELAAREGRHEEAVPLVDAWIADRRCPWFRAGLSYMHERIKLYVDVTDNRAAAFNLGGRTYRRFAEASSRLERMLPAMLTSRYIATFDLPLRQAG